MALIKCPECGQDVSDKADICIHCGYPLSEYVAELNDGAPRYDLYANNVSATDEDKEIEKRLLEDLLGMPSLDVVYTMSKPLQMVAQNLSVEQVSKAVGPFIANGVQYNISIFEHGDGGHCVGYTDLEDYSPEYEVKQDHYDQVINEAQKVEIKRPERSYSSSSSRTTGTGIKCPNCGSTKVQRITMPGRVASTAVFGIASKKMAKTYKCNSCGHTW